MTYSKKTWPSATSCSVLGWFGSSSLSFERFISWFYVCLVDVMVACALLEYFMIANPLVELFFFCSCWLNDYFLATLWYVELFLSLLELMIYFLELRDALYIHLFCILSIGVCCSVAGIMLVALFLFRCLLLLSLWIYLFLFVSRLVNICIVSLLFSEFIFWMKIQSTAIRCNLYYRSIQRSISIHCNLKTWKRKTWHCIYIYIYIYI